MAQNAPQEGVGFLIANAGKLTYIDFSGEVRPSAKNTVIGYRITGSEIDKEFATSIEEVTAEEAEYRALIQALESALESGRTVVRAWGHSKTVVEQVRGTRPVNPKLRQLNERVTELVHDFEKFDVKYWEKNTGHREGTHMWYKQQPQIKLNGLIKEEIANRYLQSY